MSSDAFRLENVQAHYGDRLALDVPEMAIPEGKITAIVGPNGSGKSTLVHLLAFLKKPSNGRVLFFGGETIDQNLAGTCQTTWWNCLRWPEWGAKRRT